MRFRTQLLLLGTIPTCLLLAANPSFAENVKPHCMAMDAAGQQQQDKAMQAYMSAAPPLWSNLGSLTYPVTTRSTEAQHYFDQGLKLNVNFNHAEAQRAFRHAQKLDPNCAMCYFGEALVLGPNINVPMAPAVNAPALAVLRKAQSLASTASDKERALIAALALRYSDDPVAQRPALDAAFADAMSVLADKYPDDLQIAVLAAEAAMVTQPWDYWQAGGHDPKGRTARALELLEGVLAKHPDHPGAIHLYIHLVEASDRPERAEPYADRLAALMPGAGHIVHMPSHIYHRVGRHRDSLDANKAAAKVDEAYIAETGAVGVYPIGYYAHNLHFVLISAQQLGDRHNVLAHADKLDKWLSNDIASAVPMTQPIKAAPYFAYAQYAAPETILSLPEPVGAPPYVKAMWHYARGTAHAAMKNPALARADAAAIEKLARESDWSALDAAAIPARPVLEVAKNVVLARAAQTEKDRASAIALFEKAVAAEETLPYMEPPYWYYPVRQSLEEARQ
jgi:tetratricopeptide (TPR) repeat protein